MTPLLSKLTMCVCAASTGAAIVPAAHAVNRHFAPHHPAVRQLRSPFIEAAARPDCLPGVTSVGGGLGEGGGSGSGLTSLSSEPTRSSTSASGGFPFSGFAAVSGNGGGGLTGGSGPDDSGPGGSMPGSPSSPGVPPSPGLPLGPEHPRDPACLQSDLEYRRSAMLPSPRAGC